MSREPVAGRLLIASATLQDPNFARSVVLIGMHGPDGALGLVLNRPSTSTVAEAVPQLAGLVDEDEPLYVGGPVRSSSIVVLCEFTDPEAAGMLVLGRIGLPAADLDLDRLAETTSRLRIFAGYSGWGESQLDGELEQGDWIEQDALPDDVFCHAPEELWSATLARKGGRYALIARMPLDPSVN
jgi:putative transcriptional regulator